MYGQLPVDIHFVETVFLTILNFNGSSASSSYTNIGNTFRSVAEKLDRDENNNIYRAISESPLLKPNVNRPVYWISENKISYAPTPNDVGGYYQVNYVKYPQAPNWTYVVDSTTQSALYNSSAPDHRHFELHRSEENNLVTKILLLAGISMKDAGLAQLAGQKEASIIQQEKQ